MIPTGVATLGRLALTAGLYTALGLLALGVAQMSGLAAPVWPAAGIAFALTFLWGWRALPGVLVGSFAVNAIALSEADEAATTILVTAAAIGLGAALQALAGSDMVRHVVGPRIPLAAPREILLTLLVAGPVACLINPTIGIMAQLAEGLVGSSQATIGWVTWWIGDSIGVIVFAPLCLMLVPGQGDVWQGRRWKVALPSLTIIAAFGFLLVQNTVLERERVDLEVNTLASEAARDLVNDVARQQDALASVTALIAASEVVTAEEFETFTAEPLKRYANLQAMSWNPRVAQEDLSGFEAAQRAQPGRSDFAVTERDANGELRPVGPRPEYVVVEYIEPLEANKDALGFDILSNPARQAAIAAARDTGQPTGTAPIDLVQESGSQKGMLALVPLYTGDTDPGSVEARRAKLRGFAVGVYRLQDLLGETFKGGTWDRVDIRLLDVTDAEPVVIADLTAREPATVDEISRVTSITTRPIEVYGRSWELQVQPTSGPLAAPTSAATPALLVGGLVVVFLLEALVLLLTGLEQKARREAEDSSFEANHDALTGLLNRRAFVRQFEAILAREREDGSTDLLLFCDLDGFKLVNDEAGHEAGDRMLLEVTAAMREAVRSHDVVARMGGDEFAVILVDCPPQRGITIAESVLQAVTARWVPADGRRLSVGVSIGGTVIGVGDPVATGEYLRRADTACYEAKRSGKGQIRLLEGLASTSA